MLKFGNLIKELFSKHLYNPKWRCNVCGKEIFNDKYLCESCSKKLKPIVGTICNHCGRPTIASENYCSTCKQTMVSIDKGRSAFAYDGPIKKLIKDFKYNNSKYLCDFFVVHLANIYFKNYFNSDYIVCVPMSKKASKTRNYNHSQLLAMGLSDKVGVGFLDCIEKKKETKRQARLNKKQRLENLKDAFKVINKPLIKNKSILIVDDVSTTGATLESVAKTLKKAGALKVDYITVACVPPVCGY